MQNVPFEDVLFVFAGDEIDFGIPFAKQLCILIELSELLLAQSKTVFRTNICERDHDVRGNKRAQP